MKRGTSSILVLTALALVLISSPGSEASQDGQPGWPDQDDTGWPLQIVFAPTSLGPDSAQLDPAGFEVVLSPLANQDLEHRFRCDDLVEPPPGRFKYWIEGNSQISPHTSVLQVSGRKTTTLPKTLTFPVVPAGIVAVDEELALRDDLVLRLLHTESHTRYGHLRQELSRRVTGARRFEGVLMPEGNVIGGLWDPNQQTLVAITKPRRVSSGRAVRLRPLPPSTGADVVVVLERPEWVSSPVEYELTLELVGPHEPDPRYPDVVVPTANRLFAFWYEVAGRYVALRASSDSVWLPAEEIALRAGQVSSFRGALRQLPSLDVELALPPPLDQEPAALLVMDPTTKEALQFSDLDRGELHHRFENVQPGIVNVVAALSSWRFTELVDLTDGLDQSLIIQPTAIEVSGTVYKGSQGHPAILRFHSGFNRTDSPIEVEADSSGEYTITLFHAGQYSVEVTLIGAEVVGEPWSDRVMLLEDTLLDVHISTASYRARIIDSESGAGIEGAKVVCRNTWGEEQRVVSRVVRSDSEGYADLFPMRPGRIELVATANGYLQGEQTSDVYEHDESEHLLTLALDPVGESDTLVLVLSGGRPAYEAEVVVLPDLDAPRPTWSGRCDHRGVIRLPKHAHNQLVLVRHPGAAFIVRRWQGAAAGPPQVTWHMPPLSSMLHVRAHAPSGEAAGWANLAFEIEGSWIRGWALSFVSYTGHAVTDSTGGWSCPTFPELPARATAWSRGTSWPSIGELESMAIRIDPPWAGRIIQVETFK